MGAPWRKNAAIKSFEPLKEEIRTDVLVIGGGMTGLLCAYMLRQAGIDCVTPEKAPKEEMEKIKLFMSEEEADFVSSCYKEDKYKDKEILVLKDNLSEKDSDSLAKTLEKPIFSDSECGLAH